VNKRVDGKFYKPGSGQGRFEGCPAGVVIDSNVTKRNA